MQSQYNVQVHVRIFSAACVESLQILGHWSLQAYTTTHGILTSPRAQAGYRLAWFLTRELSILAWMIAVFCITVCLEQMDTFVQSKLQEPAATLDTLDLTLDTDPDLDRAVQEFWALDTSESDPTEPDPWELPTVIALPPSPFTLPAPCSPTPLLLLPAAPTTSKARRVGDSIRAVAAQLREEQQIQIKATSRILAAAAKVATNHDRLIDEVTETCLADLEPSLAKLTVRELRKMASAQGYKGTTRWSKAQCLKALGQEELTA